MAIFSFLNLLLHYQTKAIHRQYLDMTTDIAIFGNRKALLKVTVLCLILIYYFLQQLFLWLSPLDEVSHIWLSDWIFICQLPRVFYPFCLFETLMTAYLLYVNSGRTGHCSDHLSVFRHQPKLHDEIVRTET